MRTWIASFAAVVLAGCVVFPGNVTYPGGECRMLHTWCVVEVRDAGYLAVAASAPAQGGSDSGMGDTVLAFRFAPREHVTARWSSAEITLVDVSSHRSMQAKAL